MKSNLIENSLEGGGSDAENQKSKNLKVSTSIQSPKMSARSDSFIKLNEQKSRSVISYDPSDPDDFSTS